MVYHDDARDVKFNLFEWLPLDELLASEKFGGYERADLDMILDEALKVCQGGMAPANEESDVVGARWDAGKVTMPESSHRAYKLVAEGGWIGATASQEFGGMGLPECVGTGIMEYLVGSNTSLALSFMLGRGAAQLIETFGSDELKKTYCEKMYAGRWAGTMCLTEPGAGSDLGDIKTKAIRQSDGTYRISGEKIFITSGEHDMTENIVHAVLARVAGAPSGPKGLSLFVVPKVRVNPDGSLGEPNDVCCSGIEEKLGIHGSPTCSLVFGQKDGCVGYLLGRERLGLLLMFQMMNSARYEVGVQGLALASAAHYAALAYARERLQGRDHENREPSAPQVPILRHPDVRRSLLLQRAYVYAMRALLSRTAFLMDKTHACDGEEKDRCQGLVEILTPVCKAWCSDWGFRVTEWAMQVYGGYGYTREFPAEQYLRDAKIASIYEGTNYIQAQDLVGRKFRLQGGAHLANLLSDAGETLEGPAAEGSLKPAAEQFALSLHKLEAVLGKLKDAPPVFALQNALLVLDMMGHVVAGGLLLEQAALAQGKLETLAKERGVDLSDGAALKALLEDSSEARFYHGKVQAAIHFAFRGLPQVHAQAVALEADDDSALRVVL